MERGLASPAKPILPWTPMTERNASPQSQLHRLEVRAPMELSATVPLVAFVLHRAKRVPDRRRTTALSALPARSSSTGTASARMEMAFALVLL